MATTIWPYARTENIEFPDIHFSSITPEESNQNDGLYSFVTNQLDSTQILCFNLSTDFPLGVLKNGEDLQTNMVDICVQLTSSESRYRKLHILSGADKLATKISIPINLLGNSLEIATFAVLSSNIKASEKFATNKGDILGRFNNITITLKDTPTRSGTDFPTKWESFSSLPETKDTPDALHFVDIASNDPILLINDDMSDDLKRVLDSKKTGDKQIFRESFFKPIAADCVEQLARHALVTSRKNGSFDGLHLTYEKIIQDLSIFLTDIADYDDAMEELERIVTNDDDDGEDTFRNLIQTRLPLVAQEHQKIRSTLEKHAKKIEERA
jgi:hypothetical protein